MSEHHCDPDEDWGWGWTADCIWSDEHGGLYLRVGEYANAVDYCPFCGASSEEVGDE